VQEKGRDFALYKFTLKSGLRYEVAVGIVMGEWSGSMVYILAANILMSKFSMPPCWVVKMILKELRLMMGTSESAHSGLNCMVPKAMFLRLRQHRSFLSQISYFSQIT
jgi:large-conductance mechanosensitive channel